MRKSTGSLKATASSKSSQGPDTVSGRTHLSGKQENLEFHVWAEPADVNRGFDENYLRNALGYLRDCQQQGLEPSIFQMALFGWLSDTLFVAFPFYVPIWMLVLIQNFLGRVIGKKLLGYQATYEEYNTKPRNVSSETKKSL